MYFMKNLITIAGQNDTDLATVSSSERRQTESIVNVVARKVTDLNPYSRNSRAHSEWQIAQIAASIKEFGFTNPILIDELGTIIAGEGRVLAAKKLRMSTVQCIVLAGLTEAQKAAYVIADNKIALNAGWNDEMLQTELDYLAEFSFDLNLTGFSEVEIAALLNDICISAKELTVEMDGTQAEPGEPEADQAQLDPHVDPPEADLPNTGPTDWQNAWNGMPEFNQPEAGPFRTIKVHCKDQAAVEAFAKLIGQKLTHKTKWVWYPEVVKVVAGVVYG